MALLVIAIWVLIIIGAFHISTILGLIVLLCSIFMLAGGFDNKSLSIKKAIVNPEVIPPATSSATKDPYFKRSLNGRKATLDDAIKVAYKSGYISTAGLERELNISYKEAVQFIEDMEKQNIIGPQDGVRPRKVTVK